MGDAGKMPPDPSSGMAEAFLAAREMFVSLVAAGFTEQQAAMVVAGVMMQAQGRGE